jgi:hypothetical protein
MKKTVLIISLLALFAVFAVSVAATPKEICDFLVTEAQGKQIPKAAPFSNEVINLYTLNDELIGKLILTDKVIETITCEEKGNSTYSAYIKDLQTVKDIKAAPNKLKAFKEKLSQKDIILKGDKFFSNIKLFFAKIVLKFI